MPLRKTALTAIFVKPKIVSLLHVNLQNASHFMSLYNIQGATLPITNGLPCTSGDGGGNPGPLKNHRRRLTKVSLFCSLLHSPPGRVCVYGVCRSPVRLVHRRHRHQHQVKSMLKTNIKKRTKIHMQNMVKIIKLK